MSYLAGIRDKRALVADDLEANARWLHERGIQGVPQVHIVTREQVRDWEIPDEWSPWPYRLVSVMGAIVAEVWATPVIGLDDASDADRTAARARLRWVAAGWAFLGNRDDPERLAVAEAYFESVYESEIQTPATMRRGVSEKMKSAASKSAPTVRGRSAALRTKILEEWNRLADKPERNRATIIRRKLGANPDSRDGKLYSEKTIRNHLKALNLKQAEPS